MYYPNTMTRKELKQLEKKITRVYSQAQKEIEQKTNDYFKRYRKLYKEQKQRLDKGIITKDQFDLWYRNAVGRGERWKKLKEDITDRLNNANQVATAYINDKTPTIFSLNLNYSNYEIEKGSGISFSIYDEQTVKRLIVENPELLPKPRVDIPKSKRWNMQKLEDSLVSGIIQGKSVDEIAREFMKVTNMNRVSALRNARTAINGAQNGGRQQSYIQAEQMGIELQKEWISTPDGRTRDSHQDIDGETIGIHETFSNGLMYPCDAGGHPAEVYNCRCTMRSVIKGINDKNSMIQRRYRDEETGKTYIDKKMTYNQWMNKK